MDRTADEFIPLRMPWREVEKRAGSLDALRSYLHRALIPAYHGGLFTWPECRPRSDPGKIRPEWWRHAYEDRAGRMMFFTELAFWPKSGVVTEQFFAYADSIELDRAGSEKYFPAVTGPAESDGARAAQESILEQNAEPASSASAAASSTAPPPPEPVPPTPPVDTTTTLQEPERETTEASLESPQAVASEELPSRAPEQPTMPLPGEQPVDPASPDPKQPDQPQTVAPFYSGGPGRPSAVEFVVAEAKRRITAGEVKPTQGGLTKFTEELHQWWKIERIKHDPIAPAVTAKTLRNKLGEFWRSKCPKLSP